MNPPDDGVHPERLELVRSASAAVGPDGLPRFVDFTFELMIQGANKTVTFPVRISAETARRDLGEDAGREEPSFVESAWCALMVFADELHALASMAQFRRSEHLAAL